MKGLRLKRISFEKEMTVVLPFVVILLLCIGILCINRLRAEEVQSSATQQLYNKEEKLSRAFSLVLILHEQDMLFITNLEITESGEARAVPLPAMREVYTKAGAKGVLDMTKASFYADITFEALQEILQYYGEGVYCVLESAVEYGGEEGMKTSFPAGRLHVPANRVSELLRALAGTADGEAVVAALHEDMFERYACAENEPQKMYAFFADRADTDIRIYDFTQCLPWIESLRSNKISAKKE